MTEHEEQAEKNEQELNLFSDQLPENASAQADADHSSDFPGPDMPAPSSEEDATADFPAQDVDAARTDPESPVQSLDGDSPVIAPPPPPRKQPASQRPGVVSPRSGRAMPPSQVSASAENRHKPLPHALQQNQTLGQMLTGIRNARGLSLEEVALVTRIRMEYLTELEADELLKTLPPVYVSAYVRKLIEVYDLSEADSEALIEKMHGETPQNQEELPEKFIKSVNEGALVNEGESKRMRNLTIVFFVVVGIIVVALIWLIVLVTVRHFRAEPAPGRDPASEVSGAVLPAEEPVSQTIQLDESELDALIVPETPSISILKMSKTPGVRDTP